VIFNNIKNTDNVTYKPPEYRDLGAKPEGKRPL
jgi:hypothetical protein